MHLEVRIVDRNLVNKAGIKRFVIKILENMVDLGEYVINCLLTLAGETVNLRSAAKQRVEGLVMAPCPGAASRLDKARVGAHGKADRSDRSRANGLVPR